LAFRQFGPEISAFFLVVDETVADRFTIDPAGFAGKSEVVGVRPGADLARLVGELPDDAALLVASAGLFVRSTDIAAIGGRRIAVFPCGSTPVEFEHLRYFLDVAMRTDPDEQVAFAERFFDGVARSGDLRLVDDSHGTECAFDPRDDTYEWNQQAGILGPGEQQIAPAGELSVLPMDIMEFDPSRRLALTGTLTLRGEPIVHAGYDPALSKPQSELYRRLTDLRRHPVTLDVENGVIRRCRAGNGAPEAQRVAAFLDGLLRTDARYRTVWELGFGINTGMNVVQANCGLNEVYGASNGVVHVGLGLTPHTMFALTFLCPSTRVVGDGQTLLGTTRLDHAGETARRIRRTRDASCGCH
jgi:hypothetical protein